MKINEASFQLLRWIRASSPLEGKSFTQIKSVCDTLFQELDMGKSLDESYKRFYVLFYPLLRRGLVDFTKSNRIVPIPEHGIYDYQKKEVEVIIINPSMKTKEKVEGFKDFRFDCYGTVYFKLTLARFKQLKLDLMVLFQKNSAESQLKKYPNLFDCITSWKEVNRAPKDLVCWGKSSKTKSLKLSEDGYYWATEESHSKKFFIYEDVMYELPSKNINPDATYIAKQAHLLVNGINPYHKVESQLECNLFEMPIILERIIRLSKLDLDYEPDDTNPFQDEITFLSKLCGKEIERIFRQKKKRAL